MSDKHQHGLAVASPLSSSLTPGSLPWLLHSESPCCPPSLPNKAAAQALSTCCSLCPEHTFCNHGLSVHLTSFHPNHEVLSNPANHMPLGPQESQRRGVCQLVPSLLRCAILPCPRDCWWPQQGTLGSQSIPPDPNWEGEQVLSALRTPQFIKVIEPNPRS